MTVGSELRAYWIRCHGRDHEAVSVSSGILIRGRISAARADAESKPSSVERG